KAGPGSKSFLLSTAPGDRGSPLNPHSIALLEFGRVAAWIAESAVSAPSRTASELDGVVALARERAALRGHPAQRRTRRLVLGARGGSPLADRCRAHGSTRRPRPPHRARVAGERGRDACGVGVGRRSCASPASRRAGGIDSPARAAARAHRALD